MLGRAQCAGGVGEDDAGFQELQRQAFAYALHLYFGRAGRDDDARTGMDHAAAGHQHVISGLHIFVAAVGARADVHLVDVRPRHFAHRPDVVGCVGARGHGLKVGHVVVKFLDVGRVGICGKKLDALAYFLAGTGGKPFKRFAVRHDQRDFAAHLGDHGAERDALGH